MGIRENFAYVLDGSQDKLWRQISVPNWGIRYAGEVEDGWLINSTNKAKERYYNEF